MLLMLVATLWLGSLGFLDDYKKLQKHNKDGMKGKYKIIGQVGIAVILAGTMYFNPDMVTVRNNEVIDETTGMEEVVYEQTVTKSRETTLPFVKNNNFNYSWLTSWMGEHAETGGGWFLPHHHIPCGGHQQRSQPQRRTRRHDLAGLSAVAGVALAVMAYLGGNIIYSAYLNIMYVPGRGTW